MFKSGLFFRQSALWDLEHVELISAWTRNRRLWNILASRSFSQPDLIFSEEFLDSEVLLRDRPTIKRKNLRAVSLLARLLATQPRDNNDVNLARNLYEAVYEIERPSIGKRTFYRKAPIFKVGEIRSASHSIVFIKLLIYLGKLEEARDVLGVLRPRGATKKILNFDLVNPFVQELEFLDWVVALVDLVEISNCSFEISKEGASPFDRIIVKSDVAVDGPLVTVIVTCFKPDESFITAIKSVINQTYKNLEILVIDDASGDEYSNILADACALDSRIRLIALSKNGGNYIARNQGIAIAKGEFITFHDSDDWSSPLKIELQIKPLLFDSSIDSSYSRSLRVDKDLMVNRHSRNAFSPNLSSLLVRRELFEKVGTFDEVRKGADIELIERIQLITGQRVKSINRVLSLVRVATGSLTSGDFFPRYMSPERVLYRSAFRLEHLDYEALKTISRKRIDQSPNSRGYPLPESFEIDAYQEQAVCDIVIIADLSILSTRTEQLCTFLVNSIANGFSIHLIHGQTISFKGERVLTRKFGVKSPQRFFAEPILDICKRHNVTISTLSRNLAAKKLVIFEPFWSAYPSATESRINVSTIELVQLSDRLTPENKRKFETLIKSNLNQLFPGVPVAWCS
jgi:glycosyltransferase involved in cell wall biosynthesis